MPELVGDAGLLVDPYDIQAIVEAAEKLLGDETLRKKMTADGLNRTRQFDWGKMALSTLEVYREVLG